MNLCRRLVVLAVLPVTVAATGIGPAAAASGQFTISGSGWGHGVGMPQWGAYQQAVEGRSEAQILQSYYRGTSLQALPDDRRILVNIAYQVDRASVAPTALGAGPAGVYVSTTSGGNAIASSSVSRIALLTSGSLVIARLWHRGSLVGIVSGPVVVVRWSGNRDAGPAGKIPATVRVATGAGGRFGGRYRDGVLMASVARSRLNVVNRLRLHDEYLNGIAEVSASWPAAALRAQAVTARSYALSKESVRSACRCHVDDGTGPYYDQTFTGYERVAGTSGSRWADAVAQTAPSATTGTVLTYAGDPIAAFYYASSGGRTANSEDVWGGKVAWARSVADPWSLRAKGNPDRSWQSVRSAQSVAAAFGLPNVVSVAVERRDASGQIRTVVGQASSGRIARLSGPQFGSRLGLRSLWVTAIK